MHMGHDVTLFTYAPDTLKDLPRGVRVENADAILALDAEADRILRVNPQVIADAFRYRALKEQVGTWIDTDMLLVKPVEQAHRLFCRENSSRRTIAISILRFPIDDPLLEDLLVFTSRRPVIAPWWTGRRALRHKFWAAAGRPIEPEHCQWGTFGPKAMTHFADAHGCSNEALVYSAYHPVPLENAVDLITPGVDIQRFVGHETVGIHLWASRLRKTLGEAAPPDGSFLAAQRGAFDRSRTT